MGYQVLNIWTAIGTGFAIAGALAEEPGWAVFGLVLVLIGVGHEIVKAIEKIR